MKATFLPLGAMVVLPSLSASNWPQFRGLNACGVDTNGVAPIHWNVETGENILWRTPLPGLGHSSPIVWNDRLYITTAVRPGKAPLKVGLYGDIDSADDQESQEWRLISVNRVSGKVEWDKLGYKGVPRVKRHTKSSHCNTTPTTDGQRIAAIFGSEGLFCFDMEGNLLWKKDLGPMDSGYYQVPSAQWGFASSPVIHDGKVVVVCDVQKESFVAVFDLQDGKQLWRTPRKDVPGWGTPTIAVTGQQTQILVNGWHHIGAYDFATGKEIWKLNGGGDIPVPTPILGDGLAYFTSGHGNSRPMRAIRLTARGDITPKDVGDTNASIAWAHARQGCYMQTPILTGGAVYGCLDNGVLSCFDATTGKLSYNKRIGSGSEGFTASPVSDGRHLYFTSEGGTVYILPANSQFEFAATNSVGETCMASPALLGGTLYFRTTEHLVAIGETGKSK